MGLRHFSVYFFLGGIYRYYQFDEVVLEGIAERLCYRHLVYKHYIQ